MFILLLVIKMNREDCFRHLFLLEYTDCLDDNDRKECIVFHYKQDMWMKQDAELDFSEKCYIDQVFDDYLWWKDKMILFLKQRESCKPKN
jgi:hypothetical protein